MSRMFSVLAALLVFAAPALATDYLGVLEGNNGTVAVDTVAFSYMSAPGDTFLFGDFNVTPMTVDTAIFRRCPMAPIVVAVSYLDNGHRAPKARVEFYNVGSWIDLRVSAEPPYPRIKVVVRIGIAEEPSAMLLSSRLTAAPNPLSRSTVIRCELANAARVRADVFDASGRLVRTLADTRLETGAHALPWDARDNSGVRVESGVYLVRLVAGDGTSFTKLVVND